MTKEQLHEYCLTMKGATTSYKEEWDAFLFLVGDKFFALMGKNKEADDIISLKCEPSRAIELRAAFADIEPGYYLNKTHWNSIKIKNELDPTLMKELICHSYELVFKGLTKKEQIRILGETS